MSSARPGDHGTRSTHGGARKIDRRLDALRHPLDAGDRPLEETCDRLLRELRSPDDPDDVALLIARTHPYR
ncbi:hypothetical protein ACFOSC_29120 [Streptantibioticus rubrisoli]|uniref:hypothetical protein n=1 Tax=Streptantibioticus rubrisoli TaxID=1387313 RepID=UPI0026E566B6|nr:hypothetical protein [Streptantibioticus rubrisoli]